MAHQHQKGHTVPKQVSPLDDDDDITESTRKKSVMVLQSENCTAQELHCVRAFRYQAKSENVRQDLIPRVRHGEAALCTPRSRLQISVMSKRWRVILPFKIAHVQRRHFKVIFTHKSAITREKMAASEKYLNFS